MEKEKNGKRFLDYLVEYLILIAFLLLLIWPLIDGVDNSNNSYCEKYGCDNLDPRL